MLDYRGSTCLIWQQALDPALYEDHPTISDNDIVRQKQTPTVELLLYSVSSFGDLTKI
jgi:hypothetical protein